MEVLPVAHRSRDASRSCSDDRFVDELFGRAFEMTKPEIWADCGATWLVGFGTNQTRKAPTHIEHRDFCGK